MKRRRSEAAAAAAVAAMARPQNAVIAAEVQSLVDGLAFTDYDSGGLRCGLQRIRDVLQSPWSRGGSSTVTEASHEAATPALALRRLAGVPPSLDYAPPTSVHIVGSFVTHTLTQPHPMVDVAVDMHPHCFAARDVKNYAYHDKRCMYLGVLAAVCGESGLFESVKAEAVQLDVGRPVLMLHLSRHAAEEAAAAGEPDGKRRAACVRTLTKLRFRVLPTLPAGLFSPHVMAPTWNNVRPWILLQQPAPEPAPEATATPMYNGSITEDACIVHVSRAVHACVADRPALRECVAVLKSWARRRGLSRAYDGVSSTVLTAIVCGLLQERRLLDSMSTLQCLRATLMELSTRDFNANPISLHEPVAEEEEAGGAQGEEDADAEDDVDAEEPPSIDVRAGSAVAASDESVSASSRAAWQSVCGMLVLLHGSGHNISYRVSHAAAAHLKAEAAASIQCLHADAGSTVAMAAFERTFATILDPARRFDRIVCMPAPDCPLQSVRSSSKQAAAPSNDAVRAATLLCDASTWAQNVTAQTHRVLKSALTDRVSLTRVFAVYDIAGMQASGDAAVQSWPAPQHLLYPLNQPPPSPTCYWVCVQLNGDAAMRIVERGPAPDDVHAAAAFKELWGEWVQLRRFQDGVIVNAVLFDAARLGGRAYAREAIVPLIISHVTAHTWGVCMPSSVLHAGDALTLQQPAAEHGSSSGKAMRMFTHDDAVKALCAAHALAAVDVCTVTRSLSLERLLDVGSHTLSTAAISYRVDAAEATAAFRGASTVQSPLDALHHALARGVHPRVETSSSCPPTVAALDPFTRGPTVAASLALHTLDAVVTALKAAPGVPLRVLSVQHTSPQLRYTSPFPAAPHPLAASRARPPPKEEATLGDALVRARAPVAALMDDASALALASAAGSSTSDAPQCSQIVAPMEIVLMLESSARWPADVHAIAALKTAFYVKLRAGVLTAHRGGMQATAFPDHLDIMCGGYTFRAYLHVQRELDLLERIAGRAPLTSHLAPASGPVRAPRVMGLVVHAPMTTDTRQEDDTRVSKKRKKAKMASESHAAAPALDDSHVASRMEASAAATLLDALFIRGVARVRHAAFVHQLATTHLAFAPAVRLATLWLASGGCGTEASGMSSSAALSGLSVHTPLSAAATLMAASGEDDATHIVTAAHAHAVTALDDVRGVGAPVPHEVVELMMAHVFIAHAPFPLPGSPASAFLHFLHLLAEHDWHAQPLLIDTRGDMTEMEHTTVQARFQDTRTRLPEAAAMYVLTSDDSNTWQPVWTMVAPTRDVLGQIVERAQAAVHILTGALAPVVPLPRVSYAPQPSSSASAWWMGSHTSLLSMVNVPSTLRQRAAVAAVAAVAAGRALPESTEPAALLTWPDAFVAVSRKHTALTGDVLIHQDLLARTLLDGRCMGSLRMPYPLAARVADAAVAVAVAAGLPQMHHALVAAAASSTASAAPAPQIITVIPPPAADVSKCQLLLYKNLLRQSRAELLVGVDPLACLLRHTRAQMASAGGHPPAVHMHTDTAADGSPRVHVRVHIAGAPVDATPLTVGTATPAALHSISTACTTLEDVVATGVGLTRAGVLTVATS